MAHRSDERHACIMQLHLANTCAAFVSCDLLFSHFSCDTLPSMETERYISLLFVSTAVQMIIIPLTLRYFPDSERHSPNPPYCSLAVRYCVTPVHPTHTTNVLYIFFGRSFAPPSVALSIFSARLVSAVAITITQRSTGCRAGHRYCASICAMCKHVSAASKTG